MKWKSDEKATEGKNLFKMRLKINIQVKGKCFKNRFFLLYSSGFFQRTLALYT